MAVALLLACPPPAAAQASDAYLTEVVTIPGGGLRLRGLLARPTGDGPFPAYIQNHGFMTFEEARRGPWTSIARDSLSDTLPGPAPQALSAVALAREDLHGPEEVRDLEGRRLRRV